MLYEAIIPYIVNYSNGPNRVGTCLCFHMAVTELGERGTGMTSGYSKSVGWAKNPNVPAPPEGLDELIILRNENAMSTGIWSATRSSSVTSVS